MTKFMERTYEKVDCLFKIRKGAKAWLVTAEKEINQEQNVCNVNVVFACLH